MRRKNLTSAGVPAMLLALAVGLTACVDRDYDLTKDMDLTVTFGGDSLFVPGSNTEELTMDNILDIDDESNVMAAEAGYRGMEEGDYYLYADNKGDSNHSTLTTEGVRVGGTTVDFADQSVESSATLGGYSSHFTMSDDVSPTVVEIDEAKVTSQVSIKFTSSGGSMSLESGFEVRFPDFMELEKAGTDANAGKYNVQGNTVTMTASVGVPVTLTVNATAINLANTAEGEITFTPGDKATDTQGFIELQGDIAIGGAVSVAAPSTLGTEIVIGDMTLESVYGIVDPDIDISVDPMVFDDVPDLLQDEETNLDWKNPQIYLTVTNPTELSVDFQQIKLTTYRYLEDGTTSRELLMGTGMANTTGDIVVGPDRTGEGYTVCISQTGSPSPVDDDVMVDGLADIIRQIPDRIEVTDIEARAVQERCWIDLDRTYDLDVYYEVVSPLSFGGDLVIAYKDTLNGWRHDLEDIKRVNELQASLSVVNKVPLELTLSAVALDTDGNEIPESEIKCEVDPVEKAIAQGSVTAPTTSDATVRITARDGDISRLDGMIVRLTSTKGDGEGATINQRQSIKLENVRLLLVGGITIDLN